MEQTNVVFEVLNSNNAASMAGFLWGFVQYVKPNKKTINRPLLTMLNGVVEGAFYSVGAVIVSNMFPPKARFIVPVVCVAAVGYHLAITVQGIDRMVNTMPPSSKPGSGSYHHQGSPYSSQATGSGTADSDDE